MGRQFFVGCKAGADRHCVVGCRNCVLTLNPNDACLSTTKAVELTAMVVRCIGEKTPRSSSNAWTAYPSRNCATRLDNEMWPPDIESVTFSRGTTTILGVRGGQWPGPCNGVDAVTSSVNLSFMSDEQTTAVVQRYIDELAGDAPSEPIVRCSWIGPSADSKCSAPISCTEVTRV